MFIAVADHAVDVLVYIALNVPVVDDRVAVSIHVAADVGHDCIELVLLRLLMFVSKLLLLKLFLLLRIFFRAVVVLLSFVLLNLVLMFTLMPLKSFANGAQSWSKMKFNFDKNFSDMGAMMTSL